MVPICLQGPYGEDKKINFLLNSDQKLRSSTGPLRVLREKNNYFRVLKINISIGDDMELTLKQFKGAIKEDKQIYKKGG